MTAQSGLEPAPPAIGDVGRALLTASRGAEITGILVAVVALGLLELIVGPGAG